MTASDTSTTAIVIRTSHDKWLEHALKCYTTREPFVFKDDAGLGIQQEDLASAVSLISAMKKRHGMKWKQIAAIVTGLGLSGVGIWLLWAAWIDPEPYSKLTMLLAGGFLLTLTGGLSILYALGQKWHVTLNAPGGIRFEVKPL